MTGIDTMMMAGYIPILLGIVIVVLLVLSVIRDRKKEHDSMPDSTTDTEFVSPHRYWGDPPDCYWDPRSPYFEDI